ncbi:MAG: response regulator [Lysobacterales bacterium]
MKQLLLIDDDAAFLATYQRALQRRGHQVHTASCGREALAACLADAGRPAPLDGIVLDLRLGQENGLQLIDQLRQWQPDIPLLLLTGYASIATAVEAIKRGASDYRPKPIGADELLAALFPPDPDAALPTAAPARPIHPRRLEWEHLQRVLIDHDGNISAAARALGLHRRTLQRKLAKRPVRERPEQQDPSA